MAHEKLVARWRLAGDARDTHGLCHGQAQNVEYSHGLSGAAGTAALFNGRDSRVEIPDIQALRLHNQDFTLTTWVRCHTPMRGCTGAFCPSSTRSVAAG